MNYIYIYSGDLPKYAITSINNVLSVDPDSNIVLCTDRDYSFPKINNITFDEVESKLTEKVRDINYFGNNENPLWSTSLLRIFYLLDIAKFFNFDNFIHFDVDVMIYKPFKDLESFFDNSKFNITALNELDLIFSYSYTKNIECYELICEKIYKILENPFYYEEKYYDSKKLNEMMLLNIVYIENNNLFNLLPTIPDNKSKLRIIFDSITYGQYLSGVHNKLFSKNIIEESSYVGRFLIKNDVKIKFKQTPYIIFEDNKFELANLHVHSKKLNKFTSKGFECFIN